MAIVWGVGRDAKIYRWIILACLLLAGVAAFGAAPTISNVTSAQLSYRQGISGALTIPNYTSTSNTYLLVAISLNVTNSTGATIGTVTYNGNGLTLLGATGGVSGGSASERVEFWGTSITTGVTANVVITPTNVTNTRRVGIVAGVVTVNGVAAVGPVGTPAFANATSNSASITVSSTADQLVLDTVAAVRTVTATVGAGQTQQWTLISNGGTANDVRGAGSTKAGATTVTMTEGLSGSTAWEIGAITFNGPPPLATLCATPGKDGAGSIGGTTSVVNAYYAPSAASVVLSPGATSVALAAGVGANTDITAGDLLLIMQMQDADIDFDNDQRYGSGAGTAGTLTGPGSGYTTLNSAGLYEYVVAQNTVTFAAGGTLNFLGLGPGGGLANTYTQAAATGTAGQSSFQVIRVPQYSSLTLGSGTNTTVATPWNGNVGGVFAVDVSGTVTLNGTVNVDALGFRGGGGRILTGGAGAQTDYVTLSTNNANSSKGEGIAGTPKYVTLFTAGVPALVTNTAEGYPNGSYARGAPGTAGGGGTDSVPTSNADNDGGGGGGNGGAGGGGGNSWNANFAGGGFGGVAFPATINRVTMGGGGGAGTTNNGTWNGSADLTGIASSGGTGGGLVIIRAIQVSGTGTISANGGGTLSTLNDSTGGGGAGGTVVVIAQSGTLSGLTASAVGGTAGNAWPGQGPGTGCPGGGNCNYHGPGGGGGGGVVILSSAVTAAAPNVSGGANGTTTTSAVAYGATTGSTGVVITNATLAQMGGPSPGGQCAPALTDLSVLSSASPTLVADNGVLTFTDVVMNNGPADATSPFFTTAIPAGGNFTFQSIVAPAGWSCTTPAVGGTGAISCVAAGLTAGSSATFAVVTSVGPTVPNGTTLTASAQVSSLSTDPIAYNNTSTASATVGTAAQSDLAITDVAAPTIVTSGSRTTLTHVLTYTGAASATTVVYKESFPAASATVVTLPAPGGAWGTCTQATAAGTTTITCTDATLASGSAVIFSTALQATATFTDATTVSSTPADTYLANNTASATVTVTASGSTLTIRDQASPVTVYAGNNITFSPTVVNSGPAATSGTITMTETLPAGTTFVSYAAPTGWTCNPVSNVVTCSTNLGVTLAAGSTSSFQITTAVPLSTAPGTVETDSASVTGGATASASSTVAAIVSDMGVTLVSGAPDPVLAGSTGTMTLVWNVTDSGSAPSGPASFRVSIPANTTFSSITPPATGGVTWTCGAPSGGSVLCTASNVPVGYSQNFSLALNYTSLSAGNPATTITSTASVIPNTVFDPIPGNNSATFSTYVVAGGNVDLGVTLSGTPNPINPGSPVAVTAGGGSQLVMSGTVTNKGPGTSTGTTLTFVAPTGTTVASFTGTGCSLSVPTQTVTCNIGSMLSGGSSPYSVTLNVTSAATGSIISTVNVSSDNTTAGPDGLKPAKASATATNPVITSADVSVTNTCTPLDQQAGSNITCSQKITNLGPSDAQGVTLTEAVPANTTLVSATGATCNLLLGTVTCNVGTVTASTPVTITFTTAINGGTARGTQISDTVNVSTTTPETNLANNSATATVTVANATDNDLAVTDSAASSVAAGSNITYTQTLTNNGPAAVASGTTMTVTEIIPANTTFVSITPPANWTCPGAPGTGTFTCTTTTSGTNTFALGATANFTMVVNATSSLSAGTVIEDTFSNTVLATDPNSGNNSATTDTTINSSGNADVSVAITPNSNPDVLRDGTPYTFTITASNAAAGVTATNTIVDIPIPSLEQYVSATPSQGSCSLDGANVTCNLGSIANSGNATVTLVVNAINYGETNNTASVSADQTDPTPSNNNASVAVLILAPTEIKLVSFEAVATGGQVVLEWRTGEEAHNLGFNVYREVNGQRVKLNPSLVAGSAVRMRSYLPQHTATAYTWVDNAPVTGAHYWLEDVELSGARTEHGPAVVSSSLASGSSGGPIAKVRASALLANLNSAGQQTAADATPPVPVPVTAIVPVIAADSTINPVTPAASGGGRPGRGQRNASTVTSAQLAGQQAIKIAVNQEGWYRVTGTQLGFAGLPGSVNLNTLRLINEGNEVPLRVTRSGNSLGSIEFYGIGLDNQYTDTRIYWLIWGNDMGQRLQSVTPSNARLPATTGYEAEAVREDHAFYFAALTTNGDADNFFGDVVTGTAVPEHLEISGVDTADSSTAQLDVLLQGVTAPATHEVAVTLNGVSVGQINFADMNRGSLVTNVPTNLLNEGDNTVTLTPLGGDTDVTTVAHVIVMYERHFQAINDQVRFSAIGQSSIKVTGFSVPGVHVVNLAGAMSDVQVSVTKENDGTYSASFNNDGSAPGIYYAYTDAVVANPLAVTYHQPSSLSASTNAADLLIIAHGDFIASLAPLVKDRQQQGLKVKVVDVDDVYSEFDFGEHSPYAMQSFLQLAAATWSTAPRWLLLAGDASVDPRNYLGFGSFDFVPTKIVPTGELKTASDGWFTDFNQTGVEQIATGRLPVRTAADVTTVVNKILAYESQPAGMWSNTAYFVADENIGADFQSESATVAAELPASLNLVPLNVSSYATDHATLINQLNAGNLIVNYLGHGSENDWADPSFFSDADASALTNGAMAPFFINMACLNGLFHDVYETSLATSLIMAPNGGAIAVWASSGLTDPEPQLGLDKTLMQYLFATPSQTIGEATRNAKQGVTDLDVRRTWILFGDPSLQLKSAARSQ